MAPKHHNTGNALVNEINGGVITGAVIVTVNDEILIVADNVLNVVATD